MAFRSILHSISLPYIWLGNTLLVLTAFFVISCVKATEVPSEVAIFSRSLLTAETGKSRTNAFGLSLIRSKQYGAAEKVFEALLVAEPRNVSLLNNLGYAAGEAGDSPKAIKSFEAALALSKQCAECWNNLGTVHLKQGNTGEAKHCFEQSLLVKADSVDATLNLATVMEEEAAWPSALLLYRRAQPRITNPEMKKWVDLRITILAQLTEGNDKERDIASLK